MSTSVTSRLLLIAAAVLFSTGGAAIKATTLNGWQVAGSRSAIAALALLMLVPAARRDWSWRVLPAGAAYASTLILFVLATKLTTAANSIFLQSTAPLFLLLIGPFLLKEAVHRSDLPLMAGVAAGMAMLFAGTEPSRVTAPDPVRGNQLAALAGLTWALTIAGLRWVGKRSEGNGSMATVVAGNLLVCTAVAPFALPISNLAIEDAAAILYLGVVQIGVAYWCLTRAIRHVSALEAATLILLEPVLNPIWTWLLHGERPSPWAIAGGGLILGATLFNVYSKARQREEAARA
jgi:drug/metabolite transporter (DMT)-like permease